MLSIVLVACTQLGACQEVKLPVDPNLPNTPFVCMRAGEELAAKWLGEHPGYKTVRIRCGKPEEKV